MMNERYGPHDGCYPIAPTRATGDGAPDRFATPFVVTDADRIAALDREDRQSALERHLATLERMSTIYDADGAVVAQHESGATPAPSDGPVYAPSFRIGTDGLVYGRRSVGIVGSVTPDGYPLCVHPFIRGTGDGAVDVRIVKRPTNAQDHAVSCLADLGGYGSDLGVQMDKRRTLITRAEQPDRFRLARTNGLDRLATRWARLNGAELEPLIGTEYVGPHQMFSLDQTAATDEDGNVVHIAAEVAVWRNGTLSDDARALYGGHDVRRWNGAALVTRDGYDVVADRYGYDDIKRRRRGRVTDRLPARRLRLPSMTTLQRHAERLALQSEPRRHPRTGEVLVTRTGKVRLQFYRQHSDGRRVYVSPADTLIRRTAVDGYERRDDDGRVTERTAGRVALSDGAPSGMIRLEREGERSAVVALTDEAQQRERRARKADAVPDAERAARVTLEQMERGERRTVRSFVVTRRTSDGRWSIRGTDTRYVTSAATARAICRGGSL